MLFERIDIMIMEVKIVNLAQASAYIKYFGIQPLRVEVTDRLVFVFDREETKVAYDKWCNHELKPIAKKKQYMENGLNILKGKLVYFYYTIFH